MRRRGLTAAVTTVALLVGGTGVAEANTIKHRGTVTGIAGSKVMFAVKKEGGDLQRVTNLRFNRVPVTCSDGTAGLLNAELPNFGVAGKKFTRKGPIQGVGINNGTLRAFGQFSRGGKRAKGNVRIAFQSDSGAGCGTSPLNWVTR